jgi:ABC-type sugar transport system permease subunit
VERKTFFFFVGPSVIIMLLLMILPLVAAIILGFNYITYRNLNEPVFVGLRNYLDVLQDPEFWDSLWFTVLYILIIVPSVIVVGFIVALLLDQVTRFRGIFIAGALLPFIVTPVVGTLMFRDMFDRGGLYTYLLKTLFDYKLLMTSKTVPVLIMLHGIWYVTPFAMIVLFAGLQTVPKESLEAALVDGANWLQRLWYVVIPHLRSLFVFIALISIMDAYRVFDSIFVLTQQNPIFDAETIMYYNFQVALSYGRLGKANAMSILTVIGIFIVLIPFLVMTYREQVEER